MRKGSIVINTLSNSLLQFLHYIFPIIALPYFGQIVGPEKFGVVNFLSIIVGYFTLAVLYGFDISATRAIAQNQDNKVARDTIFSQIISAKTILFAIATLIFALLTLTLPEIKEEGIAAWSTFLVCFGWMLMPNWFFQGMQRMDLILPVNFIVKVIFVGLLFVFIQSPIDYFYYPLLLSLSVVIVGIFTFVQAISTFQIRFEFTWKKETWNLLASERYLFFTSIVNNTYQTSSIIIIGIYSSFVDVGHFSLGWRLMNILQVLVSVPIAYSVLANVASHFTILPSKGLERVGRFLPIALMACTIAFLAILFSAPFIIHYLFGDSFLPSLQYFQLLAIIPFITLISNTLSVQILLNLKHDRLVMYIITGGAMISILSNLVLLPVFGVTGAAIAMIFTEIAVLFAFTFVCYQKKLLPSLHFFRPLEIVRSIRLLFHHSGNVDEIQYPQINEETPITLIIPTLNRSNVWPVLLESINKQSVFPSKIIIVDQSTSTEHSGQIIEYLGSLLNPEIHIDYIHMSIQNRCTAKEMGFNKSENGMVVMIDDDVELPPNLLQFLRRELINNPNHVVSPRVLEDWHSETYTKNVLRFTWYGHFYNNFHSKSDVDHLNCYCGGCFAFIKSSMNAHFTYEKGYIGTGIHEETDFAHQFLDAGYSIVFRSSETVLHFPQENGNAYFKNRNPINWYADNMYNFGLYHRKFKLNILYNLRLPYMVFTATYLAFIKYPSRQTFKNWNKLANSFSNGYRHGL